MPRNRPGLEHLMTVLLTNPPKIEFNINLNNVSNNVSSIVGSIISTLFATQSKIHKYTIGSGGVTEITAKNSKQLLFLLLYDS